MFSIFYLWEHTQKFNINNWNWRMVTEIKLYLTFWHHPKVTSLTLGWNFYLHFVLLVIPVDLICHLTTFENKWHPWAPLASQSPTPWAWPRWKNENPVWYVFVYFICTTHTKFGKKKKNLWNWLVNRSLIIFDNLTSPEDHQFDPRMKILLAFCSARHPRRFDMPHDHVWIKWPKAPLAPQSPTPGAWPRQQNYNPVWYVLYYLLFVRKKHKVLYKNLWNWLCNWN